jgi:Starch-binding associating with outer membrane
MKLNKIIYVVPLAVLLLAAGSGCRKGQFNINKNVNQVTDSTVTYFAVLPSAMNITSRNVGIRWGTIQNWMSYWARSGTYAPNVTEETYQITNNFGTGVWDNCYDNNYDYAIVQTKAAVAGAGFYEGIARIMKALNYQILVDVYGDVPYTQALKGSGNPTPAYDKGLDIYKSLLREIDAGLVLINAATVTASNANKDIATNDIMFKGNKTKWNQFGNTLKLRLLIHCSALASSSATIDKAAEIAIINLNGNGFLGAGGDAMVNPGYTGDDKPNSFYNGYIKNTDGSANANNVYYKANEWGIEYYKFDGDPRTSRFYVAGTNGLVGVAYGLAPVLANAAPLLAGIGPALDKGATAPSMIFSAAESFFLQSEARWRGIITSGPTAAALLNSAMIESFIYTGAATSANAQAAVTAYVVGNGGTPDADYAGGAVGAGGPTGGLFTILQQKWFALNGLSTLEIWTDWRRVAYTEVATKVLFNNSAAPADHFVYGDGGGYPGSGASSGPGPFRSISPQISPADQIPVRYLYPQTEYNYNGANVPAGINRYSKVFWDVN